MQDLRLSGLSCETDYLQKGLKGQFKDADKYGAKLLIILNSDDLNLGMVTIKDNVTKEEQKVAEDEIIDYIMGMV